MKGVHIHYSAAELAWVKERFAMPRAEMLRQYHEAFRRPSISLSNLVSLCKRKGWLTGRTGCFAAGTEPANKGQKMPYHPNCAATQFKKGGRSGIAVTLYKPIGTERVSKNGYPERKINDDMPIHRRWRGIHLVRWEAENGPIPQGMALKCLNGDKLNTEPANWTLISRALLPRLSGGGKKQHIAYDAAPAELKPTLLAIAELEHRARTIKKEAA